uniref:RING-type domain-containing protein n=1 Tax=Steinernema glaseri TaxID=37863 RepID=A0A1I7YLS7_9BILA
MDGNAQKSDLAAEDHERPLERINNDLYVINADQHMGNAEGNNEESDMPHSAAASPAHSPRAAPPVDSADSMVETHPTDSDEPMAEVPSVPDNSTESMTDALPTDCPASVPQATPPASPSPAYEPPEDGFVDMVDYFLQYHELPKASTIVPVVSMVEKPLADHPTKSLELVVTLPAESMEQDAADQPVAEEQESHAEQESAVPVVAVKPQQNSPDRPSGPARRNSRRRRAEQNAANEANNPPRLSTLAANLASEVYRAQPSLQVVSNRRRMENPIPNDPDPESPQRPHRHSPYGRHSGNRHRRDPIEVANNEPEDLPPQAHMAAVARYQPPSNNRPARLPNQRAPPMPPPNQPLSSPPRVQPPLGNNHARFAVPPGQHFPSNNHNQVRYAPPPGHFHGVNNQPQYGYPQGQFPGANGQPFYGFPAGQLPVGSNQPLYGPAPGQHPAANNHPVYGYPVGQYPAGHNQPLYGPAQGQHPVGTNQPLYGFSGGQFPVVNHQPVYVYPPGQHPASINQRYGPPHPHMHNPAPNNAAPQNDQVVAGNDAEDADNNHRPGHGRRQVHLRDMYPQAYFVPPTPSMSHMLNVSETAMQSRAVNTLLRQIADNVECPCCNEIMREPVSFSPCNHSVCSSCVGRFTIRSRRENPQCPRCLIAIKTIAKNPVLGNIVHAYDTYTRNVSLGLHHPANQVLPGRNGNVWIRSTYYDVATGEYVIME